MGLGKALSVKDQAHYHLFGIRSALAGVSPLSLGVLGAAPLEVSGGEIIEVDLVI